MSTPENKGASSPATGEATKPEPKDASEEFGNLLDLAGDLVTGRRTPKSVVVELLEKVFPDKKTDDEKPGETKPTLRAVEGGAGK